MCRQVAPEKTIKIFTQDKDALREAICKGGERMSARELADRAKVQERQKLRPCLLQSNTKKDKGL